VISAIIRLLIGGNNADSAGNETGSKRIFN